MWLPYPPSLLLCCPMFNKGNIMTSLFRGRTLSGVGQIVLEEFGQKLDKNHSEGRQIIRELLEKHCKISKAASRDLFSLLEEAGTFCYRVDIPEDFMSMPLTYPYEADLSPELLYLLNGWWEIRA